MIALVDTHISTRLKRFKIGTSTVLNVYGPGATREIGETQMPCIAISHHMPPQIDNELSMPHHDVFTASIKMVDTPIPEDGNIYLDWIEENNDGLTTIEGPEEYTWSRYPTPIKMFYQLDLLASNQTHMTAMQQLMFEAIPPGYAPTVNGYVIRFEPYGDQSNLDDLENPLFRTVYRYEVCNIWIDRLSEFTSPGIVEITTTFEGVDELPDS